VITQLQSELLKQQSTRTNLGLLSAMVGLVLLAVLLHGLGLPAENVDSSSEQLTLVVGWGEKLAALFAGLLGATSMTSEIRHGTIRPTFLVTPERGRVVAAKVFASMGFGACLGVIAAALAVGVGSAALAARGIENQLDGSAYALFFAGGGSAGALWAAIGVGLGAIVRNQVPTLVGICAWLLFVEGLLLGDVADVAAVGRFAPGAAAAAISGQDADKLVAPAVGLGLLGLYAAAAALAGLLATTRRDVV
jgi:ABC-type transport system involved in multi-copper enzyme maturation permease subunit